ncbi:hypothetical protein AB0J72_18765 [Dactylosporangium sp. NPDC049742]|uniref:hypothetical protein n=1 Tax=Dactylosporangium sp. NPDC049742 TaxID=3154737 RepID=UPI0034342127
MTTDPVSLPQFWQLRWRDVDPAARPVVDPAGVADLVRALPPAADVPPAGTDWRLVDIWYDRMTRALVEHLGDWVVCWWYTVAMEDVQGRGPVPVWRAERPAVTAPTPEETLSRLADAVVAWHELLVELATDARGRFAAAAPAQVDGTGEPPAWQAVRGDIQVIRYTVPTDGPLPYPWQLIWADTDVQDRPFDPGTVRAVVDDLVAAIGFPGADRQLRNLWLDSVSSGLAARYGRWAVGWRWSVGEGDLDGGPVGSWCCVRHSVTTPEATVAAISAALIEWRAWLDDLAERFDRFLPHLGDDIDGWERAVAHLVTAVGDRTQYESGWYGCCTTVLWWFLEAAGIESARRTELIEHAVGGRFRSWVEPKRAVVLSVAEDLAQRVAVDRT